MRDQVLLVAGIAFVVLAAVWVLRRRPFPRGRRVTVSDLPPGVYLLTSEGCDTCSRARSTLERRRVPFSELSWQQVPAVFEQLGIDAVPSVVAVDSSGRGRWWRGGVPSRLQMPGYGSEPG